MTWFKVDDGLHAHKKAARAGVAAMGLWVLAGSWSADQLTDGFIPDYIASRIDPDYEAHAARLVSAGLWEVAEDSDGDKGWQFHDWDDEGRQPTAASVKAKQQEARDRMARLRAARKRNDTPTSPEVRANTQRTPETDQDGPIPSGGVRANNTGTFADGSTEVRSARPVPSRPVPSVVPKGTTEKDQNPLPSATRTADAEPVDSSTTLPGTDVAVVDSSKPAPAKRGTRLVEGWIPSEKTRGWARTEFPAVDVRTEHEKFSNYWLAKSGRDATKVDWDRAWQNWIITAAERSGIRRGAAAPVLDDGRTLHRKTVAHVDHMAAYEGPPDA